MVGSAVLGVGSDVVAALGSAIRLSRSMAAPDGTAVLAIGRAGDWNAEV
jgi:hypothetical protein